jgi:hypothetical protein
MRIQQEKMNMFAENSKIMTTRQYLAGTLASSHFISRK